MRTRSVYGEGDPCAPLMVIGEGPGENEDLQGRPFVGRAGELLEKMLAAIGLARGDVFICNTVKCRPTLDDGGRRRNRAPDAAEMANCRPYLDEQIEIVRPRVILALGSACGEDVSRTEIRRSRSNAASGSTARTARRSTVSFHPAYLLRLTGGELTAVKRLVWKDLLAVRARLEERTIS